MRLTITLGQRSAALLKRAIGRLDTDEVNEAKALGLSGPIESFVTLPPQDEKLDAEARDFGTKVEELWQAANIRWGHPLDLKSVWTSLDAALARYRKPEDREGREGPIYGISDQGRYDEPTTIHVFVYVVALGVNADDPVVVGIKRGRGRMAEAPYFWPELNQTEILWTQHAPKIKTWAETKAQDRIATTRKVAERLVEVLKPDAFEKKARTNDA